VGSEGSGQKNKLKKIRCGVARKAVLGYTVVMEINASLPEPSFSKPAYLYPADRCCDKWIPSEGCTDGHTGVPAMGLAARRFHREVG
jgi:hypothetical protein